MSLIKRISASVTSTVDRAVSRVENHDAIINAALKDTQQAAARSRVRLARVQKDGNNLRKRRAELEAAVARWAERAKQVANDNESKALDCLRRRKECQSQLAGLADAIEKHEQLETQVTDNLKKIEARINEVSHQRNMMRSRQSVAEATRIVNDIEGVSYGEIEDTFDRWEINLGETEIMTGSAHVVDRLDDEFSTTESDAELKAELDLLMNCDKES